MSVVDYSKTRGHQVSLLLVEAQQSHLTVLATDSGSVSPQSSQNWMAMAPVVCSRLFR
jgi:hypothetical protein